MQTTETATACPGWCTFDHAPNDAEERWHYGPKFGAHISVGTYAGETLGIIEDLNTDDASADDLRRLAADALAAAEWLETQA